MEINFFYFFMRKIKNETQIEITSISDKKALLSVSSDLSDSNLETGIKTKDENKNPWQNTKIIGRKLVYANFLHLKRSLQSHHHAKKHVAIHKHFF